MDEKTFHRYTLQLCKWSIVGLRHYIRFDVFCSSCGNKFDIRITIYYY